MKRILLDSDKNSFLVTYSQTLNLESSDISEQSTLDNLMMTRVHNLIKNPQVYLDLAYSTATHQNK